MFDQITEFVTLATKMLPVVTNPEKLVTDATIARTCCPVNGGVIWPIAVVPVTIVVRVCGAIVVAAGIVTGASC